MDKYIKAYKYKMYNSSRNKHLRRMIEGHCEVYNYCIALHRRYYKMFGKHLSANKLKKHLTKVKKRPSKVHWNDLGSQSIQDVVERIEKSYQAFFDAKRTKASGRHSTPKFQKRSKYKSFTLKQAGYKFHDGNQITICGRKYKYVAHRPFEGEVKTVTVKRDSLGDFWLVVICAIETPDFMPRAGKAVGYDFGLKAFLTADDGTIIESPRFFQRDIENIRQKARSLSKKQKGSRNHMRAKMALERAHMDIANRRKDWFFKTGIQIAMEYADVCIENLNIKSMQKLWGRKISDYAFGEFVSILTWDCYKCSSVLHQVPRFYPSSKTCHHCGYIIKSLPLSVRKWTCPHCSKELDRDINAAINIKNYCMSIAGAS